MSTSLALVTGGAGFIGSHVVNQLLAQGHRVHVLDDLSTGTTENLPKHPDLTFFQGSILNLNLLQRSISGAQWVFHLAAKVSVPESIQDPQAYWDVNAQGTLNVLEAAAKAGVERVVLSSTCAIYGDAATPPIHEATLPAPLSPYAASKLAAEGLTQSFSHARGVPGTALRYFNVYGPRQDPSSGYAAAIPAFCSAIAQHQRPKVFGDGKQTRDFVFAEDVARANILAAKANPPWQCFNVGSGQATEIGTLAQTLLTLAGQDGAAEHLPERHGDIRHSWACMKHAAGTLGLNSLKPLGDGLKETLDHYLAIAD